MSEEIVWQLEPHTAAKHELLRHYLDRWFPIIGKFNQRINYIDGFAGPGQYSGGEKGSPIIAIESAMEHVKSGTLAKHVIVNFVFVESNGAHAAHLEEQLKCMSIPSQFTITVFEGAFRDKIGEILDKIEADKTSLAPTFAFVDPFGFSGIPMSLMARILKFPKCEVFVNIMVEFINRFLKHPDEAITKHFPETFGTPDVLNIGSMPGDRKNRILRLYTRQLKQYASFVRQFDMRGYQDQWTYSLFFASNAPKGFEKMKEAMWAVDKAAGSEFSDAKIGKTSLLTLFQSELLKDELLKKYTGKTVLMAELEKFVIEETDYVTSHIRDILTEMEASQEITVLAIPGYKRHGKSFKSDKVRISFRP